MSRRLGRRPVSVRRLGESLVLWRGAGGQPVAMVDRCPHRGAALSRGRLRDGEIECPYHGFRYAPDGHCTAMPCEGTGTRLPGRLTAVTRSVREEHGIVWVWSGEPVDVLPATPWFAELDDLAGAAVTEYECRSMPIAFARLMENSLDVHHLPFIHRTTSPGIGPVLTDSEVTVDGDLIHFTATQGYDDPRRPRRPIDIKVLFPAVMTDKPLRGTQLLMLACPIDDVTTWMASRWYLRLPLPSPIGQLAAAAFGRLDRQIVLRQDVPNFRTQLPFATGRTTDRLIAGADKGTLAYERLWLDAVGARAS